MAAASQRSVADVAAAVDRAMQLEAEAGAQAVWEDNNNDENRDNGNLRNEDNDAEAKDDDDEDDNNEEEEEDEDYEDEDDDVEMVIASGNTASTRAARLAKRAKLAAARAQNPEPPPAKPAKPKKPLSKAALARKQQRKTARRRIKMALAEPEEDPEDGWARLPDHLSETGIIAAVGPGLFGRCTKLYERSDIHGPGIPYGKPVILEDGTKVWEFSGILLMLPEFWPPGANYEAAVARGRRPPPPLQCFTSFRLDRQGCLHAGACVCAEHLEREQKERERASSSWKAKYAGNPFCEWQAALMRALRARLLLRAQALRMGRGGAAGSAKKTDSADAANVAGVAGATNAAGAANEDRAAKGAAKANEAAQSASQAQPHVQKDAAAAPKIEQLPELYVPEARRLTAERRAWLQRNWPEIERMSAGQLTQVLSSKNQPSSQGNKQEMQMRLADVYLFGTLPLCSYDCNTVRYFSYAYHCPGHWEKSRGGYGGGRIVMCGMPPRKRVDRGQPRTTDLAQPPAQPNNSQQQGSEQKSQ